MRRALLVFGFKSLASSERRSKGFPWKNSHFEAANKNISDSIDAHLLRRFRRSKQKYIRLDRRDHFDAQNKIYPTRSKGSDVDDDYIFGFEM